MRSLRKTGRNGVLFTICMDLDNFYEGETFVLSTQSDTIYRSLTKPEHYELIKAAFAALGMAENGFSVRMQGKQSDDFNEKLAEIKETFGGVKIDVK